MLEWFLVLILYFPEGERHLRTNTPAQLSYTECNKLKLEPDALEVIRFAETQRVGWKLVCIGIPVIKETTEIF